MNDSEIYQSLQVIFADVFLRDDIVLTPATAAPDIEGWDSFKQIEIIMASEEKFAVKFQTRDIDRLKCVGDLVAVIRSKL